MPPRILWFRQDLRLQDNAALKAAAEDGSEVVCLYILDDETPGHWALGGASQWWLHHSLMSLRRDLETRGGRLTLRRGRPSAVLNDVVEETRATAIYFSRAYEPCAACDEQRVADALHDKGIGCHRFGGTLLFEPETVLNQSDEAFRVFTPFYKACQARPGSPAPIAGLKRIRAPSTSLMSEDLEHWRLTPSKPDWAGGLRETWSPGEAGARRRLEEFLADGIAQYDSLRNRPDTAGTSRLSPHLHFGELSPRQVWHAVTAHTVRHDGAARSGADSFLRELFWREFSYHQLFHAPSLPESAFRTAFNDFPWNEDESLLEAWQRGLTGYPIVDAGMRELWHSGWMHNRVRMITASFLIKHLLIPWQRGEAWFWDTLVDADLANNAANWQWVAGSGADAAPYFRIFNPVLQGRKFDPDGEYVRKWVPELASMPPDHIHAPWRAPAEVLAKANVSLRKTYPLPIVDHDAARKRALAAFESVRGRQRNGT